MRKGYCKIKSKPTLAPSSFPALSLKNAVQNLSEPTCFLFNAMLDRKRDPGEFKLQLLHPFLMVPHIMQVTIRQYLSQKS